ARGSRSCSALEVEPPELVGRELDLERGDRGVQLRRVGRSDQGEGRERLREDEGERGRRRGDATLRGELLRTLEPAEVVAAVPAANELVVLPAVVNESRAATEHPCEACYAHPLEQPPVRAREEPAGLARERE